MCSDGANYPKLNWESIDGDFACPNGVGQDDLTVLSECWLAENIKVHSDINDDDTVHLTDFIIIAQHWLKTESQADITGDGNVDHAVVKDTTCAVPGRANHVQQSGYAQAADKTVKANPRQ